MLGPLFILRYPACVLPNRFGQVWLYHGGTPLRELLQPHGFKEKAQPLENLEHDELNRLEDEHLANERGEIQL